MSLPKMTIPSISINIPMAKRKISRQISQKFNIAASSFWYFKNVRLHLCLLLCLNFLALALMRNGLGMAMVCMVNNTALNENGKNTSSWVNNTIIDTCPIPQSAKKAYDGEFLWDNSQQGMLFAAIYWGSMTSLPAGWLSDRYSPRHLLLFSAILNIICSFLTPVAAKYGGYIPMFIIRVLMGTGQGLQKPAVSAFTARWIPTGERSTVISVYTAGNQFANIIGSPANAWMCSLKDVWGGWPLIFIVSGGMGMIWCLLWITCVRNCPEHQRRISVDEKHHISTNLKTQNLQGRKQAAKNVPWKELLLSMPVIACSLCSFVNGFYVSLTSAYIPTYFREVLKLNLKSNGFYGSLPYISQWLLKFIFAAISDKMIRDGKWNANLLSKIFNSIASFGTGAFILACGFLDCTQAGVAISFLTISMGLFGAFTPGYWTSMATIAPVYSGTISSLTTTTNQLGSILAPYVVAWINKTGSKTEWQLIFIITSATLIATGVFYIIFGSADIQPWAKAQFPPPLAAIVVPDPDPDQQQPHPQENLSDEEHEHDDISTSDRVPLTPNKISLSPKPPYSPSKDPQKSPISPKVVIHQEKLGATNKTFTFDEEATVGYKSNIETPSGHQNTKEYTINMESQNDAKEESSKDFTDIKL